MIGGRYCFLIQDPSFFLYKNLLTVISYLQHLFFLQLRKKNLDKMLDYLKTKAERDAFIDQYDNFLFDCDGMCYACQLSE